MQLRMEMRQAHVSPSSLSLIHTLPPPPPHFSTSQSMEAQLKDSQWADVKAWTTMVPVGYSNSIAKNGQETSLPNAGYHPPPNQEEGDCIRKRVIWGLSSSAKDSPCQLQDPGMCLGSWAQRRELSFGFLKHQKYYWPRTVALKMDTRCSGR